MITSTAGGSTTALLVAPIELVMIQQQLHGGSFAHQVYRIGSQFGAAGIMRGLGPTMVRDGVYVAGLLGITPVVQELLMRRYDMSANQASFSASMVGGLACSLASHPADIVKTCMQGDLKRTKFVSPLQTIVSLWSEGGLRRVYRGCIARCLNITATIYIANECVLRLPSLLFGH